MEDFETELKFDFLEEATLLLESTEQAFLQVENDLHNKDLIDEIFRFAHNLKGTSRAVGFGEVAKFTHEVENLILKIKQEEVQINEYIVSVLLECNDHIAEMIRKLKDDFDATFDNQHLIDKIQISLTGKDDSGLSAEEEEAFTELPDSSSFEEETVEPESVEPESVAAEPVKEEVAAEPVLTMEDLEAMALANFHGNIADDKVEDEVVEEIADVETPVGLTILQGDKDITEKPATTIAAPISAPVAVTVEDSKVSAAPTTSTKNIVKEDESIRVSLARVEKLNNFVGELVILQTVLEQQKYTGVQDELAIKSITQLSKLSKEIQDISMSLRMVPVKSTLQKMSRIVRDTSKALGKKVLLTLIGEETEIDKTVLEHLADPLVHIVRNAVDHGLESTDERIAADKDPIGKVNISAFHEGNNLVIEIRDDGKGINPDIIKSKAIEKGVLSANANIDDDEVIQLIFHPGFSTKDQVSEVSGRGVGMDVVKTNIEKLSGEVRVKTELGVGSVFKIVLPLTMAIIDGMIVRVGKSKFVVPLTQIHESLKPEEKDLHYITGKGDCLNLRGEVLPLKRASELLGIKMDTKPLTDQIAIIVSGKAGVYAVAVDDIIQQQQVVIKKLGDEIKDKKGFVGSSILGDGLPAFILDLDELSAKKKSSLGPGRKKTSLLA